MYSAVADRPCVIAINARSATRTVHPVPLLYTRVLTRLVQH